MKMLVKGLFAAGASVAWYGTAAAACYAEAGDEILGGNSTGSVYMMLAQVVFFLLVIIGIFLFIMKIVSQKNKSFQSGRSIKSLGGLGLGQNKSVQLVQIGKSLYVLGVGNDVELVAKIEDQEEIEYIVEHLHAGTTREFKGFPTFGEWLKRLKGRQTRSEDLDVTPSFQAVFQEKMQRMANRQQDLEDLMGQDNDILNERLNDKS
ncbi:MAG: flagellar protein [Paenibacillaceae bacterium]|jgi:flagellar protein FliO/FliZ|nr:flagellar protein [Paenibacillaceae bacterium]